MSCPLRYSQCQALCWPRHRPGKFVCIWRCGGGFAGWGACPGAPSSCWVDDSSPLSLRTGHWAWKGTGWPFHVSPAWPHWLLRTRSCTRSEGKLRDPRGDRGGSAPAPPPLLDHERVQRRKGTETGPRAEPRPGGEGHAQRGRRGPQTGLGPILAPTTVLSVSSVCRPVKPSVIRMDLSIRCRAWRACPPGRPRGFCVGVLPDHLQMERGWFHAG